MRDVIKINALGTPENVDRFDFNWQDWASLRLRTSITAPAEASFEIGDETGWDRFKTFCDLGALFVVMVNDRPRFTGRVEALSSQSDADRSTTQGFVVRTRINDALISSAPQNLRLKGASIKQFVLACYAPLGLTERDFIFQGDVSRDIMTGRGSSGQKPARDLTPLTEEQAKITPPETIFQAVDRHIRRHGFLHWDGPDGRIVVAAPDDQQEPIYSLWSYRHEYGHLNSIQAIERSSDVSESPTVLGVFGVGGGVSFGRTKIASVLQNEDLLRRGFRRTVVIIDEAIKTKRFAGSRANREFATRNRGLDRLTVTVDGLSFSDGYELIPWAPDTTVDVVAAQLGGALGTYYVEEVEMHRSVTDGDRTVLTLVAQGVWVL